MFDAQELLELTGGDAELARDLVDTFLADAPKQLSAIREGLGRDDVEAVQRAAHTLKGAIGNFSTQGAFEAARQLEEQARSGERAGLEAALERLEAETQHLGAALGEWAASL